VVRRPLFGSAAGSTAVPFGDGPGPEATRQQAADPDVDTLRAIYRMTGSPALLDIIRELDQ